MKGTIRKHKSSFSELHTFYNDVYQGLGIVEKPREAPHPVLIPIWEAAPGAGQSRSKGFPSTHEHELFLGHQGCL